VLKAMADLGSDFGAKSFLVDAKLSEDTLISAVSTLPGSLTTTRTELTAVGGSSQRTVREVRRESLRAAASGEIGEDMQDWAIYRRDAVKSRLGISTTWNRGDWVDAERFHPLASGVMINECIFGEGAQRVVYRFHELDAMGRVLKPALVAKQARFVDDFDQQNAHKFHKSFLLTQGRAAELADAFNARLGEIGVDQSVPRVSFLDCCVYVVQDDLQGVYGMLVEKRLDHTLYNKFNSNAGYVHGAAPCASGDDEGLVLEAAAEPVVEDDQLGVIAEGSESEESSSDDDADIGSHGFAASPSAAAHVVVASGEVPQAFSHFTYEFTCGRQLVCDLQGVLDSGRIPPLFELTDPAIHYASRRGRKGVFGPTDRWPKGMVAFFGSHVCGELCVALGLASRTAADVRRGRRGRRPPAQWRLA
jgi:hypothetical protein